MNKQTFIAACVQNRATDNAENSLAECLELISAAHSQGADLICLPEFCSHLHVDGTLFDAGAVREIDHLALRTFIEQAKSLSTWLLVGSIAVIDEDGNQRNRSVLIDDNGNIVARYDKIHMFDVTLGNGETYRESDSFKAGEHVVFADTPFARVGLSVCYDLRFASLYRMLSQSGASVLTVPAAFTHTTGKAHWHVLLRSRAIETGSYVIAPCQYGYHGRARTYGHSLIIDPWGEILAEAIEDGPEVITAEIDVAKVTEARSKIPALEHDRPLVLKQEIIKTESNLTRRIHG